MAKAKLNLSIFDDLQQEKQEWSHGATADQKKAFEYFVPEKGCFGKMKGTSDSAYDAIVQNIVDRANTYRNAINLIGLDESELEEIKPITLYGYEDSKYWKITSSRKWRTNLYSVTHLFFSATQVYMYKVTFNTLKNETTVSTDEYFYKDITNIYTVIDNKEYMVNKGCGCSKGKERVVSQVQKLALTVPGDKFFCATYGDISEQVMAMKNKIRDKKMI